MVYLLVEGGKSSFRVGGRGGQAPRAVSMAHTKNLLAILAVFAVPSAQALALGKILAPMKKPLVVEVTVDAPTEAWALDVEELSARLRTSGCAAFVAPAQLLSAFVAEQAKARGSFPGPVPVLCEVNLDIGSSKLEELRGEGAAGFAVRCAGGEDNAALTGLLEAAAAAKVECVVLAESVDAAQAADAGGAAAIVCAFSGADPKEGDAPRLRAWTGDDDELLAARGDGFQGFLLVDGCGGDVAPANAGWCESRIRTFRSKASRDYSGSMFASTNSDVAPPSARNPRMWAQSQRQAREMMHESARSRDLPPPKIARNTVLGGSGNKM